MATLEDVFFKEDPFFFIAEIGHNHQGNFDTALEMISVAKKCGAHAVKFQKRNNKTLFTKEYYNRAYDNQDSYGATYGEHRENLEFNRDQYLRLMEHAKKEKIVMFATAIDEDSVQFLEDIGNPLYKIASADLDNEPLLERVSKLNKPVIFSTGAGTMEMVQRAHDIVLNQCKYPPVVLQCTSMYPMEYDKANLRVIETYKRLFPRAVVGYSGHDNGILLPVVAYMLGARVFEKHFTLNRAWKGTDHKFSLEPIGLQKSIRDLHRTVQALGSGEKGVFEEERSAKTKLGKSLYTKRKLLKGTEIREEDLCVKSPAGGVSPAELHSLVGRMLIQDVESDTLILKSFFK